MYGWERTSGEMRDHHREAFTEDDVLAALRRTKTALLTPCFRWKKTPSLPSAPSAALTLPAPSSDAGDADERSFDTWIDAKAAGVESYRRGDFRVAASCFATAAAIFTRSEETKRADGTVGTREAGDDGDASSVPVELAALHSNRSSALLAAGRPDDALDAAEACVAARPGWEKSYFRRGEANFALRRFSAAASDVKPAQDLFLRATGRPDPHIASRLDVSEKMLEGLTALDEHEVALGNEKREREEKEMRARDETAKDKEITELNAAAEERERDPRVKRLVKQVERLFEAYKEKRSGPPPARLLPLLQSIVAIEPDFTQMSFQAAMVLRQVGQVGEALASLRRCLQSAPGFMLGYSVFGHMLESVHGREREAEAVYLHALGNYFDHPDAWVNLASILVRRGMISDAIGLLRQGMGGGPEGKFRKPREDPSVSAMLGYLLHLCGHTAEPTSLYMMALGRGGGPVASHLLRIISTETGEDDQAEFYRANIEKCYLHNRAAIYRGFEVLNTHFAAPQWVSLSAKVELQRLLRDAAMEGVIAPRCYVPEEKVAGETGGGDGQDESESGDDRREEATGLWIMKGKNRVYDGTALERVIHVESWAELAAAVENSERHDKMESGRGIMAQRCVAHPLLVDNGTKKATLHFYVSVADLSAAAADGALGAEGDATAATGSVAATMNAGLSTGFTLKTSPNAYSVESHDNEAHITNRGAGGDIARCDRREVIGLDEVEAWAAEVGADWSESVWPGVRRTAEAVLLAAGRHILSTPLGQFDVRAHSRLRITKVLELEFVVDKDSRPWLIGLNAQPSAEPVVRMTEATNENGNASSDLQYSGPDQAATYDGVLHRVIDEAWGLNSASKKKILDPLFT